MKLYKSFHNRHADITMLSASIYITSYVIVEYFLMCNIKCHVEGKYFLHVL